MEIAVEHLANGVKKIMLHGRMDIDGSDDIALRLASETTLEKANVIIDLSDVDFMASVGIGLLVKSYKALP